MENKPPPYDLEQVHDSEISPLMDKIIEICKREKIPMVASFVWKLEPDGKAHFCTTSLSRDGWAPASFNSAVQLIREGFTSFVIKSTKGH